MVYGIETFFFGTLIISKDFVGTNCDRIWDKLEKLSLSQALQSLDFEAQNCAHLHLATCLSHLPILGNVVLVLSFYGKGDRASANFELGQHRTWECNRLLKDPRIKIA